MLQIGIAFVKNIVYYEYEHISRVGKGYYNDIGGGEL